VLLKHGKHLFGNPHPRQTGSAGQRTIPEARISALKRGKTQYTERVSDTPKKATFEGFGTTSSGKCLTLSDRIGIRRGLKRKVPCALFFDAFHINDSASSINFITALIEDVCGSLCHGSASYLWSCFRLFTPEF